MNTEEVIKYLQTVNESIDEAVGNRTEDLPYTIVAGVKPDSMKYVIDCAIRELTTGHTDVFNNIKSLLDDARPKGEWVYECTEDGIILDKKLCSNCHKEALSNEYKYFKTDFCPHCGADMRGER